MIDSGALRLRTLRSVMTIRICAVLLIVAALPDPAEAQSRLGGHFGAVVPLVTRAQGETITVADDFVIGFPTGLTLKKTERIAFDLELVPVIQNEPLDVILTIHPGVIYTVRDGLAAGVRMAFDVNAASWGFTPLVNHSVARRGSTALFAELVAPIRFQEDFRGEDIVSIGLGIHVGVAF